MQFATVAEAAKWGRVISSPVEVQSVLHLMGVALDDLLDSVEEGEADRDLCTANNPPTDAGSRAHGTTVRALRERLIPKDWAACDVRNFSTVVSPNAEMEIAVASGDDATGDVGHEPKTKNSKGELVALGIERNRRQGKLPFALAPVTRQKVRDAQTVWILLRYRVPGQDAVRCELSVPMSMAQDGRVEGWGTRLILPELPLGGAGRGTKPGDAEATEVIDVAVVRRTA